MNEVERACEILFTSQNPAERRAAEDATKIAVPPSDESFSQLLSLLANSQSVYAQLFSATTLTRLATEYWAQVKRPTRAAIRDAAAEFLWARSAQSALQPFLLTAVAQLYARVAKWSWADPTEPSYFGEEEGGIGDAAQHHADSRPPSEVVTVASRFISDPSSSESRVIAGIVLLQEVLREFSTKGKLCAVAHRSMALSFRDLVLRTVLDIGLAQVRSGGSLKVKAEAVKLCHLAVSYDFQGSGKMVTPDMVLRAFSLGRPVLFHADDFEPEPDDLSSDVVMTRMPMAWRPLFETPALLTLFFESYATLAPPASVCAIECVLQLMSARRDVFPSESALASFLSALLEAIKAVLATKLGLSHQENHHAVCRILGQFPASPHLMAKLRSSPQWEQVFPSLVEFAVATIKAWQWSPNSTSYVLNFFAQLVGRAVVLRDLPDDVFSSLQDATFAIFQTYVATKLESVVLMARGASIDDPLASVDAVAEQLVFVAPLSRCKYSATRDMLVSVADPILAALERGEVTAGTAEYSVALRQLAWLLYFCGTSLVGRESPSPATEEEDVIDAEVTARILRASRFCSGDSVGGVPPMLSTAPGPTAESAAIIQLAVTHACTKVQRVIFGDFGPECPGPFYSRLGELCGDRLSSDTGIVLCLLAQAKGAIVAFAASVPEIAAAAITLLAAFAGSQRSCSLLRQAGAFSGLIPYLLEPNAASSRLPAPQTPLAQAAAAAYGVLRASSGHWRSEFFAAATSLLLSQTPREGESFAATLQRDVVDEQVDVVVAPLASVLVALQASLPQGACPSAEFCEIASGVIRDMTGIVAAISDPPVLQSFFGWFHPQFSGILTIGAVTLQQPGSDLRLAIESLRLSSILADNDHGRFANVDPLSPDGVLIFKLAAAVVSAYSAPLVAALSSTADQTRRQGLHRVAKYLLSTAGRALSVSWLNLGVLSIYGDESVKELVSKALAVVMALPLQDIMSFQKLATTTFAMLGDTAMRQAPLVFASVDGPSLEALLSVVESGLGSNEGSIVEMACVALYGLTSSFVAAKRIARRGIERVRPTQRDRVADALRFESLVGEPTLQRLVAAIMRAIVYGEEEFVTSLSRPLLVLSSLLPDSWAKLRPFIERLLQQEGPSTELLQLFDQAREVALTLKDDPLSEASWHMLAGPLVSFFQVASKIVPR